MWHDILISLAHLPFSLVLLILPPQTASLLFRRHNDPHGLSVLASPRAQYYQANQNWLRRAATTHPVETDEIAQARWSTAEDRLLKEVAELHERGCALYFIRVNS